MGIRLEKSPGYGQRAFIAFAILEVFAAAVLLVMLWLLRPLAQYWYVILPITLGFLVAQFTILDATVWPVLSDWIKQERYVKDNEVG